MTISPTFTTWLLAATIQHLIPTTLILTTPKRAPIRYIAIIFMIWLASLFIEPITAPSPARVTVISLVVVAIPQAVNLLLINPLDDDELCREQPRRAIFLSDRIWSALSAVSQSRAIGTSRQVKNVPPQPAYFGCGEKIPRGMFLMRQGLVLVWQYLACDIVQALARQQGLKQEGVLVFEPIQWQVPLDVWVGRGVQHLITWFVVMRLAIDSCYRVASIVLVGLGLDEPEHWPPVFGRMLDAFTLRNFWGKFWHQFLRQPFTAVSSFVARDVLHFSRPSILEQYTNIFFVFLLSGVLHLMANLVDGVPVERSGAMPFFLSMVLGIMIEDGFQAFWTRVHPAADSTEDTTPWWKRVVGLAWVFLWLGVTSTWYLHPLSQLPKDEITMVPFSVVERFGLKLIGGVVLAGGAVLSLMLRCEV
ncbi:uncharacterized protein N7498_000273 [Penicillium cinerascens]|uniref:Wax synthase domain-containing protein n=1 Tax=Penicillium cinerascens TaxID=70096 RepID=A0A9W9NE56_9EURO|nr:uncharacterized protein N7498_000273 [Penicillium cinerascens]KAJ5218174.1 hypothetical protein N7498_000273 [Penicillium cinerascens]